ncbi:hypothetical protein [Formosa haliotis]|uniref:hypothetical protein n=1 Tax=Formosa haliotis TaxID=1555194 RepID=UPI000826B205|nr:hypothetical protein [Formosa haliotis]
METHDYFISKLPNEFTRKDLLKLVIKEGYSISTANTVIEYGIITESIKRIALGKYQKPQ